MLKLAFLEAKKQLEMEWMPDCDASVMRRPQELPLLPVPWQ